MIELRKIMDTVFEQAIAPFFWVDHEKSFSACLSNLDYQSHIFATRADEGFEGSCYDWGSLALAFLEIQLPELKNIVKFDPEGSMFVAYSTDEDALKKFITEFKKSCDNTEVILKIFAHAELD